MRLAEFDERSSHHRSRAYGPRRSFIVYRVAQPGRRRRLAREGLVKVLMRAASVGDIFDELAMAGRVSANSGNDALLLIRSSIRGSSEDGPHDDSKEIGRLAPLVDSRAVSPQTTTIYSGMSI